MRLREFCQSLCLLSAIIFLANGVAFAQQKIEIFRGVEAGEGSKKNVVGVDIPFDQPKHSDLILNSGNHSPLALLDQLWTAIQNGPNTSTSANKAKSLSNNISCLE